MEDIRLGRAKWSVGGEVDVLSTDAAHPSDLLAPGPGRTGVKLSLGVMLDNTDVVFIGAGPPSAQNVVGVMTLYQRNLYFDVEQYGDLVKRNWWAYTTVSIAQIWLQQIRLDKE